MCKPFADPRIGGVGTRQSVYGTKGFLARITDMFLDHRYFDENASQSLLGQAVSCLSGRTAIYRRDILLEIEDEFMDEKFWGVPCLSGDDKRLTTLTLEHGYLTYMQRTAEVWSTFPDQLAHLLQAAAALGPQHLALGPAGAVAPLGVAPPVPRLHHDRQGALRLHRPARTDLHGHALIAQEWIVAAILVAWWQISRSAKFLPHIVRRPSSFFFVLGYVVVSWLMALIKIRALMTIRAQKWGTRQVAVENGQIVRTEGAGGGLDEQATIPMRAVARAGRAA